MYQSKRLLVGIPAYNCEKQITRVLTGLTIGLSRQVDEIIVVDNRSSDSTFETAARLKDQLNIPILKIRRNKKNVGLGGSHKVIFNYAIKENFDLVAILHGDDQASFSELTDLLERYHTSRADAVLGSRFMCNSRRIDYSALRVFGNTGLNIVYSIILRKKIKDLGSGLNLFSTELLKKAPYMNFSDGFTFNMDLLINIFKLKANIEFFPITWKEFDQVSNARTFSVGWTALKTIVNYAFGKTTSQTSNPADYSWE